MKYRLPSPQRERGDGGEGVLGFKPVSRFLRFPLPRRGEGGPSSDGPGEGSLLNNSHKLHPCPTPIN
jgi:hypothetical protein